jgi:DNA repair exonuclease SbcCD ATPase subunit
VINFERLEIRNFISYGDVPTIYEFKNGITTVIGENGIGKSTPFTDAMCYVLFNSAYRGVNLGKLVNIRNKCNLEVKLYFSKNDKKYYVHRTMKMKGNADFFGVYELIDDEWKLIPQLPHKNDYQKQFQEDILGMDKYYFELIVIKSMLKPISFVSLSKKERMDFMNNVFGIKVFEQMLIENKNQLSKFKNEQSLISNNLRIYRENLQTQKDIIEKSKTDLKNIIQKQIDELKEELVEHNEKLEKYNKGLTIVKKFTAKEQQTRDSKNVELKKIRVIENKINELEAIIRVSNGKMKLFESYCGDCPKLKEIKKLEKIEDNSKEIDDLKKEIITIENEVSKIEEEIKSISEYTKKEYDITNNIKFINNSIADTNRKIRSLELELNKKEENIELTKLEKQIDELQMSFEKSQIDIKHEECVKNIINPVKFYIVRRWMPYFNKILNEYLFKFGLNLNIIFDEQFKETITFKNRAVIDYDGLSNGQRKRVDLSIMLSLIDLTKKIKNQSYNLLVLDEVIFGLDADGVTQLLEILKEKSDKMEILFIAHNVNIDENLITKKLMVTMENGFSIIS